MLNPRVLDTSIASLLLNKSPALIPYTPYFDNALLAISFQTVAEMRFGALKAQWAELWHRIWRRNMPLQSRLPSWLHSPTPRDRRVKYDASDVNS